MDQNKSYIADIYVRLSKEDGDVDTGNKYESNSISNQKELIKQFLISHPEIAVHAIREDDGYTGTNFTRPGFQLLLQDINEKKINCVLVKDLSRVGRNYLKVGEYVQEVFPEQGIRFISVNDGYDSINAGTMDDDIIIPFKNLLNDAYSRDISVKIRSNLDVKRKKGEFTGAFTTFGYRKSELNKNSIVIDDYAAKVVKDIFKWKLEGMNQIQIAERLNAAAIPSPMEYKKMKGINYQCSFKKHKKALWCAQTVSRILKNEVYIGNMIQGIRSKPTYRAEHVVVRNKSEWIRNDNAHEAIIKKIDFERVQEILKRDTRTAPNQKVVYPFSGMLFCGDCRHSMIRKTVPGPNGKKYIYFICSSNKINKDMCSSHMIKEDELEATILELLQKYIRAVLNADALLDNLAKMDIQNIEVEKLDERVQWNRTEIEKCKRLKLSLYEDLREEVIDKEEYIYLKEEYQLRINEAEEAIKHLGFEIDQIHNGSDNIKQWVTILKNHLNVQQINRKIAAQLIDRIYIYKDGSLNIRFKFQDKQDVKSVMKWNKEIANG